MIETIARWLGYEKRSNGDAALAGFFGNHDGIQVTETTALNFSAVYRRGLSNFRHRLHAAASRL